MSKTALVLGGGGAKGSYQVGVIKALKELKINYDIIVGCSVGSINGAVLTQGDYPLLKKMWQTLSTDKILDLPEETDEFNIKGIIEGKGYGYSNLKNLLAQYINENKLRNSQIDFGLVTVKHPDMTPLYIFKNDMEDGRIIDYVLGSSAFFPAMKPHKIGDNFFIDGGFSDNLPINMAINKGANKVIAVDLKAVGIIKKPENKNIKITRISSYWDLGPILQFDPKQAKRNIKLGYLDTLKAFSKTDGFKYSFFKNEINSFLKRREINIKLIENKYFKNVGKSYIKVLNKSLSSRFTQEIKDIKKPTELHLATFILENIMYELEIPALQIYKLKKANFVIKRAIKNIDISDYYDFSEKLINLNIKGDVFDVIKSASEIIGNSDKVKFIKFLSENIDYLYEKNPKLPVILGICSPKEFFSALFLKELL